mmetsp:Transcript_10698/g.65980  ORF Transcript_10698/g.65980 Transcript_10698/m.65980 type:complete len:83 (-) Transcript_10698:1086-1334(-)
MSGPQPQALVLCILPPSVFLARVVIFVSKVDFLALGLQTLRRAIGAFERPGPSSGKLLDALFAQNMATLQTHGWVLCRALFF